MMNKSHCCSVELKKLEDQFEKRIKTVTLERDQLQKQISVYEKNVNKNIKVQKRLRESEKKYRLIFDSSPRGIFHFDINGKISTCNKIFAEIIGLKKRYIIGNTIMCFVRDERMRSAIRRCLSGDDGYYEGDYFCHPDSKATAIKALFSPILATDNRFLGGVGIVENMSDRIRMKEMFTHQVLYDPLTNLPNKEQFRFQLNKAIARVKKDNGYRFAVLFFDLDHFKVINDGMGHIIGDKLLITTGKRLKKCLGKSDFLARFGGDEFAILLENIDGAEGAIKVAEKIQKKLSVSCRINNHEVFRTNSIGIALSLTGYDRVEEVLRDADTALFRAKALGRARYEVFDSSMRFKVIERLQLENDLRESIEQDAIETYYQPIVCLKSGRVLSLEALARWKHPDHGFISPEKFIPMAEEAGLIASIGKKIIQSACSQNSKWHKEGFPDLNMSVNVSAKQFQSKKLCTLVEEILNTTGMSPKHLDIEITENVAMEDCTHSISALGKLHEMGISISIDDFGSGYSSFGYLKKFTLNTIKIDKTFVSDITTNPDSKAIINAIITMARNLKLKVVAEGVETKEQLAFLKESNCDAVQGFYLCKPKPANQMTSLLHKHQGRFNVS